jgi:hypothetical protein
VTRKDSRAFGGLMAGLGEAFNEPVSEARVAIYFEALEDLPIDALQSAARAYAKTGRFFPKPVELRDLVQGTTEDHAEVAWLYVVREVRRVGWSGTPRWPDAATEHAALGLFGGGWRTLCEHLPAQGPELLGYRKAFVAAYGAAARQTALTALPPTRSEAKQALADLKAHLKAKGLSTGDL